jgi:1,4-alpha-glucan branching enzyme
MAAQGARREGAGKLIKMAKPTRNGTVRVTFELPATEPAGAVSVVGDFNGWDPYAHPLRKRGNGSRTAVVSVPAGATLHFRYLAEGGVWFDDDTAGARDAHGACLTVPG